MDVGDEVKNFVIKLHETHGKEKFMIFMEARKCIELETFPKKAPEIKTFWTMKSMRHSRMCPSFSML
eukprot:5582229-Ditylum_brightwellii.AAC.1